MRTLVGIVVAVALSGCSLTFQRHLPDGGWGPQGDGASCSASRVLPMVDAALLAAEVLAGAAGFVVSQGLKIGDWQLDRHEEAGTMISGGALFVGVFQLASAGNGFRRAESCRRARAEITAAR